MKKLYTAVGRMQFKGRNRDMRCPMVLLNNKEYILDIQEMMIWSILNWRILSDDEIKTLYENKAQETGYMTHRSAAECMQRLVRRGLVAEGEGELGADALFNLLSGLYVVPISESPILRLISFIRLTVFEHIPYAVTKQIFRRDKRNSDEQKVMLLANQAMLSTAEMIKCAELNTFAFDSEDELIDTLYHDEYTTSENGNESTMLLGKQSKVKIGYRYRFYFKETQHISLGSEYLNSAMSSDHFLGYEELGEFTAEATE